MHEFPNAIFVNKQKPPDEGRLAFILYSFYGFSTFRPCRPCQDLALLQVLRAQEYRL